MTQRLQIVIAILKHASGVTAAKNKATKAAAQAQRAALNKRINMLKSERRQLEADREAAVALKKERWVVGPSVL